MQEEHVPGAWKMWIVPKIFPYVSAVSVYKFNPTFSRVRGILLTIFF